MIICLCYGNHYYQTTPTEFKEHMFLDPSVIDGLREKIDQQNTYTMMLVVIFIGKNIPNVP